MEWQDIYPELVNKFRWAISTALGTQASRYPFQDSQLIATVLAQDVIQLVKLSEAEPGVLGTTSTIRGALTQSKLDKILD